jgi:arabinofuranan 3-O-arabinosyltransferase
VAEYTGIKNVTASSSASSISALPGQSATGRMPFSAIDGDPRTLWESGSLAGPVHQWLQVDFDHPVNPGLINVAFADSPLVGPPVTKVDVQTAAGSRTETVHPDGARQSLVVPPGASTWLRITIEGVQAEPYALDGSQAGISEISVPGVDATRTIMAPAVPASVAGPEPSVLLAKAEPQPTGCMLTSLLWVCSPYLVKPTEEQYGFNEGFTASQAHPATLSGLAVLTDPALITRYAFSGQDLPKVTASSTYTSDPEDMASSAFDGSTATEWIAGANDQQPVLHIKWHGVRKIKSITVIMPPGGAAPMQLLISGSHGQTAGGIVGTAKRVVFSRPMRTNELTLTFSPTQLPLQVSEIVIPGLKPLRVKDSAPVRLKCGLGPTISVDGQQVPTSAAGTYADLLYGLPMYFKACSDVTVQAGQNKVIESDFDPTGFDVQSVLVDPPGWAALQTAAPVKAAAVQTIKWTASSRIVRVAASHQSYLQVAQNFNAGWVAKAGGRVLQPVRLDGWEQAWLLPAGTNGLVTLTYKPQAEYQAALAAGLATLLVMIGLAVVPLRRRRRRGQVRQAGPILPPPDYGRRSWLSWPTPARAVVLLAGTGCVAGAGLWLGGYPGALLLPAATLVFIVAAGGDQERSQSRWRQMLSAWWLVTGLMVLVALGGAIGDALQDHNYSGPVVTALWDTGPQLVCLLIVARLIAELFRLARRDGDARPAAGEDG